jgi:hypothetical protein
MMKTKQLSISIRVNAKEAYKRLWRPESFPKWASGLAGSLEKTRSEWIAQTPEGPAKVRFSERNALGVLDHWVYPPGGGEIYIPLRIIANGDGCELILTLFRQPGMSAAKFAADARWVARDLAAAKKLLEAL